jgi:hypothetical protein
MVFFKGTIPRLVFCIFYNHAIEDFAWIEPSILRRIG